MVLKVFATARASSVPVSAMRVLSSPLLKCPVAWDKRLSMRALARSSRVNSAKMVKTFKAEMRNWVAMVPHTRLASTFGFKAISSVAVAPPG